MTQDKNLNSIVLSYKMILNEKSKTIMEQPMYGPKIEYRELFDHVYIKLIFPKERLAEYKRSIKILCKQELGLTEYLHNLSKEELVDENTIPIPNFYMVISPNHYDGHEFLVAYTPLMWRCNSNNEESWVEMVFDSQMVELYETDQIDTYKIDQNLAKEEENRMYIEEKRRQQEEAQKRFEEKRKNMHKR